MKVAGIHPDLLILYWPLVEPMLQPAIELSRGHYTPEQVLNALVERDMQLWVQHDGEKLYTALVTQIKGNDQSKYCELLFVGGTRLREVWEHFDWLCQWARANGCDSVQTYVRSGLKKILTRHYGFQFVANTPVGALLFKDLVKHDASRSEPVDQQYTAEH